MAILELAKDHQYMQGVIGDFAREIVRLTAERDSARTEAAALRQRIAQGTEVITAKIQTALTGCNECKVAAEAAALRAENEKLKVQLAEVKAFNSSLARVWETE